jgi:hypothetical protein
MPTAGDTFEIAESARVTAARLVAAAKAPTTRFCLSTRRIMVRACVVCRSLNSRRLWCDLAGFLLAGVDRALITPCQGA